VDTKDEKIDDLDIEVLEFKSKERFIRLEIQR
jgi:hypothetical protein